MNVRSAQKLNGRRDGSGSSADVANPPGTESFWTYPEKRETIAWSKTIRKEARGLGGIDLGKVQAVEAHHVLTVKGTIRKSTFFIPRELVQAFDGSTLWFGVEPGFERDFRRRSYIARISLPGKLHTPSSTHLRVN